ncbi:hypothetical protein EV192_111115 [Actinocrispum wychmicini]|uniref:Uncharacterized protein n=1 Tax=Actinocrispum wychmicini TaxID=1213861 RepID=A0A4R2J380_9PSEU|nr:hypothetical protein EV192_111115 [Actinocrispum wychmicini]
MAVLIAQAEARGAADARGHVLDSWSFGDPAAEPSEDFDPPYVICLRRQRDVAVESARERHGITESRAAELRRRSEVAGQDMATARSMMDRLARRTARLQEPADHGPDGAANETVADDDPVWEGETVALGLRWRLLILFGIVLAETPVHHLVFQYFLAGRVGVAAIWALCVSVAVFLVTGPYVAALLVRARQATGTERRLTLVVVVMAVFWTAVVVVLGLMCGAVLDLDQDKLGPLNLTPTTVVLMFVGGLIVAGTMAFMLGLSRRHPFQEAYATHRRMRDQLEAMRRMMIEQINPEYTEAGPEALVQAIAAAYAAAEQAYFAALTHAVGHPSFTEAVQHRRGLRQVVPS